MNFTINLYLQIINININININMSIDHLAKVNSHERDSHVSFDEGPHIYTSRW